MKKSLSLDSKNVQYILNQQNDMQTVRVRFNFKFEYFIQEISLNFFHPHFQNLIQNFHIVSQRKFGTHQNIVSIQDKKYIQKDNRNIQLVFYASIFANKLILNFEFLSSNLKKIGQVILNNQIEAKNSNDNIHKSQIQQNLKSKTLEQIFSFSVKGIDIIYHNLEIYQPIQSHMEFLNHYNKLESNKLYEEANEILYHVGLIVKHKSKFIEAQEIFKKLYKYYQKTNNKSKLCILLLNMIDCSEKLDPKINYIQQLISLSNGQKIEKKYKQCLIFKHCNLFMQTIASNVNYDSLINCTVIMNIYTYFINEVGCTIADSTLLIFEVVFKIISNKKFRKKIRNESQQNYGVLISAIQTLFQSLRYCAGSFSPYYVQLFVHYLLDHICYQEYQFISKPTIQLLNSLIKSDMINIKITFQQWFRIVYYIEGQPLLQSLEFNFLNLFSSQVCNRQFINFYEDLKKIILSSLRPDVLILFANDLSKYLTELALSKQINSIVLHYFIDLINIFCVTGSQSKDLQIFTNCVKGIYNPLKLLIYKLIDIQFGTIQIFKKIWEIFVVFFNLVQNSVDQTLILLIVNVINKFLSKKQIVLKQIPYISVITQNLINHTGTQAKIYPDFFQSVYQKIIVLLPNSIYTLHIYQLILNVTNFSVAIFEKYENIKLLVEYLVFPYTDLDDKWKQFVKKIGQTIVVSSTLLFEKIILYLTELEYQDKPRSRKNMSQQYYKSQQQKQIRKIHLLNLWLLIVKTKNIMLKEDLTQITNILIKKMMSCQFGSLSIIFHKYFILAKHNFDYSSEINTQYIILMELQYPPIIYSCLILMALFREKINKIEYGMYLKIVVNYIDASWSNIQQLALLLLGYFISLQNECLSSILYQFLNEQQIFKKIVSLLIIYKFCNEFETNKSKDDEVNMINLFAKIIDKIKEFKNKNLMKELEIMYYYIMNKVQNLFGIGINQENLQLQQQEENSIKQVVSIDVRINLILEKEMRKQIDESLKVEFALPRKAQRQKSYDQEDKVIEDLQVVSKNHKENFSSKKKNNKNNETINTILENEKIPQINVKFNTPPNGQSNKEKGEKHTPISTPKLYSTPRQKKESKILKPQKINHKISSPIIQIQSKNQKFKINLAYLNDKWRENLQLIHKKKTKEAVTKKKK